ncbi:Flp family type IVb pilin [Hyphomicrobium sp.]|uniref:Flp family type IVb pilin n=1 Tax=Hyphomicrobium sp. TaxID=82 RepID=UPI002FE267F6
MTGLMKRFWADEIGATAIEYGLLAAILGMGIVFSLTNFQIALTNLFGVVESQVPDGSAH